MPCSSVAVGWDICRSVVLKRGLCRHLAELEHKHITIIRTLGWKIRVYWSWSYSLESPRTTTNLLWSSWQACWCRTVFIVCKKYILDDLLPHYFTVERKYRKIKSFVASDQYNFVWNTYPYLSLEGEKAKHKKSLVFFFFFKSNPTLLC